jgi:pimeloyl-ACP methyl ester carboxylesterase
MFGLQRISGSPGNDHVVVILHGIRQTRDDLANPFGSKLTEISNGADVYVYGYDHTQSLEINGGLLAKSLADLIAKRVDLVGYSMGGLIARLAASDRPISALRRIVTIATPNRGALGPAQLTLLGQIGRRAFHMFSAIAPRTAGVKDLTRAASIMTDRRKLLKSAYPGGDSPVSRLSYASIPALFYHPDRTDFEFGPSYQISGIQAFFFATKLQFQLEAMSKPHDGIVTEDSCQINKKASHDWSEVHLAKAGPKGEPPLCHAVIDSCTEQDHSSIINRGAAEIAALVWLLLSTRDWRDLANKAGSQLSARFDTTY